MSDYDNYFESEHFLRMLKEYEEADETGMPIFLEADEYTDIAEYYQLRGEVLRAKKTAAEAHQNYPDATGPIVLLARIALLRENDKETAWELVESIKDKSDLDYFYAKAEILINDDQIDEADQLLNEKLENIDEENREDFILDVATLFADYELPAKAHEWLTRSQAQDTTDYKELLGRIQIGKGNYEEGEQVFNELLDQNPYSGLWWNYLASSQLLNNHIQESITSSEYSIAINPDDEEALLNKANALYSLGNYEEALDYYQRFSRLCPDDDTGEMLQGITLICLNRMEEAEKHLKKAEKLAPRQSPNLPEIYQELAFTVSHLGNCEEALTYVDKAEQAGCDYCEMMVLRGHILLEHDRMKEAGKYFHKALAKAKDVPNIFLRIGISMYDNGYTTHAYSMLKALLDESRENMNDGFSYLAACCKDMGYEDEYLEFLEIACKRNPLEARNVLGELFPTGMEPKEYYQYALQNRKEEK